LNTLNSTGRPKGGTSRFRGLIPRLGPVWTRVLIAVGAVVVVFGLTVLIEAGVSHNKIHSGVSIAGTDVGGLTRDEAVAAVNMYLNQIQSAPITVSSGDKTWDILPSDLGIETDVQSAVSAAYDLTRQSNGFVDLGRRWKLFFTHQDFPLASTVDSTKMDAVLAQIAQELDQPAVDALLKITDGQMEVVDAQEGRAVDQEALRQQLKDLVFAFKTTEVSVPIMVTAPSLVVADLQPVMEQAQSMIGSPVQLTKGDQSWTLTPEQLSSYLDVRQEDQNGVIVSMPFLSTEKMGEFFASIKELVATAPKNASLARDGTKAWVVPGVDGEKLDPEKTAEAISAASLKTSGRVAQVVVTAAEPELTTTEAEAMGVKDLLAKYTTPEYWGTSNRRQNVRMATQYCSNVLMAPGDIFNVDDQIGPRTAARGFLTAPGIVGPGKLEDVFGGGICQVSTTIFNAVFFAGIEVVERYNHSIYIDHYPQGRDATVTADGKNLIFRNDMKNYIWVVGESTGAVTTFYIYGTDDGREVTYTSSGLFGTVGRTEVTVQDPTKPVGYTSVETGGQSGKQCVVTRVITWADGTKTSEKFNSYWPMIPRKTIVGTATTTTTVPPSTSSTSTSSTSTSTTTTTLLPGP
jgi:vancomycin resistance protein YoaR